MNEMPNGIPADDDMQKRVVGTDQTVEAEVLKEHLGVSSKAEPAVRPPGDRQLPIPDYDELSVRGAKPRLDALSADQLVTLREYEAEHKKRKTLIHEINRRLR